MARKQESRETVQNRTRPLDLKRMRTGDNYWVGNLVSQPSHRASCVCSSVLAVFSSTRVQRPQVTSMAWLDRFIRRGLMCTYAKLGDTSTHDAASNRKDLALKF